MRECKLFTEFDGCAADNDVPKYEISISMLDDGSWSALATKASYMCPDGEYVGAAKASCRDHGIEKARVLIMQDWSCHYYAAQRPEIVVLEA